MAEADWLTPIAKELLEDLEELLLGAAHMSGFVGKYGVEDTLELIQSAKGTAAPTNEPQWYDYLEGYELGDYVTADFSGCQVEGIITDACKEDDASAWFYEVDGETWLPHSMLRRDDLMNLRIEVVKAFFTCHDCGRDTSSLELQEFYMVHDALWRLATPDAANMLCIGCLEKRIGRRLLPVDFKDCRLNSEFGDEKSQRLLSRMRGSHKISKEVELSDRVESDNETSGKPVLRVAGNRESASNDQQPQTRNHQPS